MLATLTLLAAAAFSPAFELEVGSGVAHSLETDLGYEYPLVVPAIQGRTAIDFPPGLALGGMFLAVVGGEAPNRTACCNLTRGYKAFSATATLFTLRVRSSGDVQVWGEGGLGVGPGSTFVVVNYTAETLSSDPVIVDANHFYLRDGKGRRFTVSDTAQTTLAFAPVNPGNEVERRPQMVLQPGVRRLLLAGFIVPEETAALGFFLYFPTSGGFDFVEVWPGGEPH